MSQMDLLKKCVLREHELLRQCLEALNDWDSHVIPLFKPRIPRDPSKVVPPKNDCPIWGKLGKIMNPHKSPQFLPDQVHRLIGGLNLGPTKSTPSRRDIGVFCPRSEHIKF